MKPDWSNIFAVIAFIVFYVCLIGKGYFNWDVTWDQLLVTLGMAIYFKAGSIRNILQMRP